MRIRLFLLAILLLLNGGVASMRGRLSEERAGLRERMAELEKASELDASESERQRGLRSLVERARHKGLPRDLSVGAVRDVLIEAQDGLALDRLSLEFRPSEGGAARSAGIQISASMVGSFEALFGYLERVESLRLPLAARALSLQREAAGASVGLTVRWRAVWSASGEPDANEVSALSAWLDREPPPPPGRDLFSEGTTGVEEVAQDAVAAPAPEPSERVEPEGTPSVSPAPEVPTLIGFVIARPELEGDVSRRVLAALRYRGEVHLVAVGDRLGVYQVESMRARERVELLDTVAGERLVLELS